MCGWVGVAGRWHGSVSVRVGGGAGRLVSMGGWASECVSASILLVLLFGIMGRMDMRVVCSSSLCFDCFDRCEVSSKYLSCQWPR